MSDTQYEVIKAAFPEWARKVEAYARYIATHNPVGDFHLGALHGMGTALVVTGQCGDALAFVDKAIMDAEKEARA